MLQLDGWICKDPREVAKFTKPEFLHGRRQTHQQNVDGWVSGQAWTQEAVCPELQLFGQISNPLSKPKALPPFLHIRRGSGWVSVLAYPCKDQVGAHSFGWQSGRRQQHVPISRWQGG